MLTISDFLCIFGGHFVGSPVLCGLYSVFFLYKILYDCNKTFHAYLFSIITILYSFVGHFVPNEDCQGVLELSNIHKCHLLLIRQKVT